MMGSDRDNVGEVSDVARNPISQRMTVANIREESRADSVEVMFLESARFYQLLRSNPNFDVVLERLRRAIPQQQPLRVTLAQPGSDIIADALT
jgi:hypothetical protein